MKQVLLGPTPTMELKHPNQTAPPRVPVKARYIVDWMTDEIKTWDRSPTDSRYHSPGLTRPHQLYPDYIDWIKDDRDRLPFAATKRYFVSVIRANFKGIVKWTNATNIGKCQRCICFAEYVCSVEPSGKRCQLTVV